MVAVGAVLGTDRASVSLPGGEALLKARDDPSSMATRWRFSLDRTSAIAREVFRSQRSHSAP
ncbi:hypothetical protein SPHINGO391_450175 [Sphingomonas aurantiaca]|uniref:Uncharacterized protein n=1 Tax=Sphingomonas aurantiaca TaxID=185949 RepID=A0A5E7ZL49_9SPHN|nr:hypothetical protein SPHINGO391_450175 [Sphingomonas aurantiaca]